MIRNAPCRIRDVLGMVVAGGLMSAAALAADKEPPNTAVPANPPAASGATDSATVPVPSNDKAPPSAQPAGAAQEATKAAPANIPSKAPIAPAAGNAPTLPSNGGDNKVNDEANDARKNARSGNPDAQRDTANPNGSRAIRHQVNRPSSNDSKGAPLGNTKNRTNIGLTFGTRSGGPLLISSVGPNGYFAGAGFQQGDQVVSVAGQQFANQANFYNWLGTVRVGQRIPFVISRNGQQQTVYWTPTQQFVQEYAQSAPAGTQISFLGIELDNQVNAAAVVASVQAGSPAQRAGVQPNDVILSVNGKQVSSPDEFADATTGAQPGSAIDLAISRDMNVQIIPGDNQRQPGRPQNLTGAAIAPAPAVSPAAVQPAPPVAPAPLQRRGLFRNR